VGWAGGGGGAGVFHHVKTPVSFAGEVGGGGGGLLGWIG